MQCSLFILMLMCIKAQAVTRLSLSNKKCNCFSSSVSNVTQMRGWRDLGTAGARPCTGLGLGPLATGPGHWRSAPVWSNWDHGTMGTLYTSPAGCPHQHSRLHPRTTNVSSLKNIFFHISMFPQLFKYHYPTHCNCKVKLAIHNCGSFAQQLDRINGTTPYSSSS